MTAGANGVDAKVLARWTGEVLRVHDRLEEQRMENMRVCKEIRAPLNDIYESAKNAGLGGKAFKSHIKIELAKRKFDQACAKAEPEDDEDLAIFEALRAVAEAGDLFDHAVKKHDAAQDDDERDLRPRHLREADKERKAARGLPGAENAEA